MLSASVYSNLHVNVCQFSLLLIRTVIILHAVTYSTIANSNYNTYLCSGTFEAFTGLTSNLITDHYFWRHMMTTLSNRL